MNKQGDSNYHIICLLACFALSFLVFLKADYFAADFLPYMQIYDGTYDEIDSIEPAFKYLAFFFNDLSIPYTIFAMLVCGFCLTAKVYYSRKIIPYTYGGFFLFIYICFYGFLHDLTQLRIAIAVVMCYIASYQYFFLHNKVRALSWMFVGILFHYSILIWCLSLLINNYRRLFIVIIGMSFGLAVLLSNAHIIAAYLPNEKLISYLYSLSYSLSAGNSIAFLNLNTVTFLLIFITAAYLIRRVELSENESRFIHYVQCSGILAFFVFFIFGNVPVVAYRLAELLRIFYPLAIVLLLNKVKNVQERILFGLIFSFYSIVMLAITFRAVSFGS